MTFFRAQREKPHQFFRQSDFALAFFLKVCYNVSKYFNKKYGVCFDGNFFVFARKEQRT